jgi:hypothetical protein
MQSLRVGQRKAYYCYLQTAPKAVVKQGKKRVYLKPGAGKLKIWRQLLGVFTLPSDPRVDPWGTTHLFRLDPADPPGPDWCYTRRIAVAREVFSQIRWIRRVCLDPNQKRVRTDPRVKWTPAPPASVPELVPDVPHRWRSTCTWMIGLTAVELFSRQHRSRPD